MRCCFGLTDQKQSVRIDRPGCETQWCDRRLNTNQPHHPPSHTHTQCSAVFQELSCSVEWHLQEGDAVDPASAPDGKVVVATVKGGARQVLLGERTALNILTRASGIATQVYNYY